jgi:peptidoglycan hydrolase CwlO-like protein
MEPVIIGGVVGLLNLFIGFYLRSISTRIANIDQAKTNKADLMHERELYQKDIDMLNQRIDDLARANDKEHLNIAKSVEAIEEAIGNINDCLHKLAQNKEC